MPPPNALILECVEKIIHVIEERKKPIRNHELLNICRPLGEIRTGAINPHLPHEIAETALNLLIQRKYAVELLNARNPKLACAEILKPLAERLPTESWRSREQNLLQQFSTPPAIAYLMARLLNLASSDEVLEPSAGTGSLAVWASAAQARTISVNEIAERRRKMLRCLGYEPTACNAEFIHDFLPPEIAANTVMMNPPFSASGGRTANNSSKFGFRHVESALERLKPGGKFGVILGDIAATDTKAGNNFWRNLADRIRLKAAFRIGGREYYKNGTSVSVNVFIGEKLAEKRKIDWNRHKTETVIVSAETIEEALAAAENFNLFPKQ